VYSFKKLISGQGPTKGCRAIDRWLEVFFDLKLLTPLKKERLNVVKVNKILKN
jgi:hypothetical protein